MKKVVEKASLQALSFSCFSYFMFLKGIFSGCSVLRYGIMIGLFVFLSLWEEVEDSFFLAYLAAHLME